MALPKFPLNFKYKALFGFRFPTSPLVPFGIESPLFEALNDPHLGYDLNVASSSQRYIYCNYCRFGVGH
jgi:hypothetical protein